MISPKGQTISVSQRTPSSPPDVSVSVVTCNNAGQLPGFLDSLRRQERVSWEAFFFDNASQDATRELLGASGLGVVTPNGTNVGYGRGHNDNLTRCRGS